MTRTCSTCRYYQDDRTCELEPRHPRAHRPDDDCPDHEAKVPVQQSNKYRPSNGTEGEIFMRCFCARCSREETCTIWLDTMTYDTDDPEYPPEWIYQSDKPVCTAYHVAAEEIPQPPEQPQPPERPKVPGEQMEMWK